MEKKWLDDKTAPESDSVFSNLEASRLGVFNRELTFFPNASNRAGRACVHGSCTSGVAASNTWDGGVPASTARAAVPPALLGACRRWVRAEMGTLPHAVLPSQHEQLAIVMRNHNVSGHVPPPKPGAEMGVTM
jgi:hypothetical protein